MTFLRDYVRSHIQLISILPDALEPKTAARGKWFGENWQAAEAWATSENSIGRNIYWTLNFSAPIDKKPKKSDIIGVRGFGIDIDPPKDGAAWDKQAALADLMLRGQPSYVIDSARGIQGVWLTIDPTIDHASVEAVNRGLSAAFGGDATHNIERLFRLPNFINHGDAKKRAAGFVPAPASLAVPFTGKTYEASYLAQYFPAPSQPETVVELLPTGPDPRWTLIDRSDDEIIKIMLAERPNLAASFGQGATVRDLWEGNEEVLSECYPGPSEWDMALIGKLSFYFGRNPAKIEEIFSRSALGKRDKWQSRPGYRSMTIAKVVATSDNVYSVPSRETLVTELPGVTPALNGEILPGGEFLTIHEQKQHFAGCVYVMNEHRVLTPRGDLLKPDQFNVMFGGHNFEFATEKMEAKAFPAFTENRMYQFPKVSRTMFNPTLPFGHIERDAVNTYFPDPDVESKPGDVTPFLNHVALQYPDPRDQEIIWTWCASLVQNPGKKFQWALFLQGAEGNGKSMLAEVIKHAVGIRYYHKPNASDITNKFNDFMMRKLFIDVQEINIDDRYEVVENLKDWITSSWIEVQPKGSAKMMTDNYANWMLVSNHKNAVPITINQRRFAPIFGAQQTAEDVAKVFGGDYFPNLWKWLSEGGYAYMTHYLLTRELHPDYDPAGTGQAAARAPMTSSTTEAIGASLGRFEQEVIEAVQSAEQGFREPWVSGFALRRVEDKLRLRMSPAKRKAALETLGYVQWGRSTIVVMAENGTKPTLYVKRGMETASVQQFIESQGYSA